MIGYAQVSPPRAAEHYSAPGSRRKVGRYGLDARHDLATPRPPAALYPRGRRALPREANRRYTHLPRPVRRPRRHEG